MRPSAVRIEKLFSFSGITAARIAESFAVVSCLSLLIASPARALDRQFSGAGDGTSWHLAANWFPQSIPEAGDEAMISTDDLAVVISSDIALSSLIVGGRGIVSCTANGYVYGTIAPALPTQDAIYLKKNGTLVLKGPGTLIVRGSFRNSEAVVSTESSVLILLQ